MALPDEQSPARPSRAGLFTPISHATAFATDSQPRESQHSQPTSSLLSREDDSDDHRSKSITELTTARTTAPTHFGARERLLLLHPTSAPAVPSSSHRFPLFPRQFPARRGQTLSSAVHRPGQTFALTRPGPHTENLPQLQQLDLPRPSPENCRSGDPFPAQAEGYSQEQFPRRQVPGLRRRQGVFDFENFASAAATARPRSPPFDLTLPTENELLVAAQHSLSTPSTPLVRRAAVSYRKNRPFISSELRQGEQRITTAPVRTPQSIPSARRRGPPFTPGSVLNFCAEDRSSSPDPPLSGITASSSTISEALPSAQEQGSRAADSFVPQRPGIFDYFPVDSYSPGDHQSSSSPLAAFDFGFGKKDTEGPARSHQRDNGTHPTNPAETQPNLDNFNFSFPPSESSPEEPSLPPPPFEITGPAPRGLSSVIAQACRKFEPESDSARAKDISTQRSTKAVKDVDFPRLELPKSPRLSLGVIESEYGGPAFSEFARGKRPELREPSPSRRDFSEDMDFLNPESAMAMTGHRREAVRMAKSQEATVVEKCKRSGAAAPGYTFDELIGKGSFGRVYKGRQASSKKVVAIKVIDIDDTDFRAFGDQKDEQINDFNKEIRILRQAQESGAPNLNQMIEALPVHSQLWLICEYCPGGSVKTLMRATNDTLGERYIIVVARELSKALKGLHDAGIMHRDIKAANVLIHEEGRLQLCDFGVATVLDKKTDKRRTFIGTLHWMPPELWDRDPEYSDEVDVWAFGCTLYECAVGKPPNADVREPQQLRTRMRRLNQSIELPESGSHSAGLRSLVSYALTPEAATRPSFSDVLAHEYLANTDDTYPTTILSELVKVYYSWLYGGGQRASLFMPGGAVAGDTPGSLTTSDEEWNFSATDSFENRMSTVLNIPDFSDLSDMQSLEGDSTPKAQKAGAIIELSAEEKANFEERVRRGADLSNIFDPNKPDYEYVTKTDFVPIQQRRVSDLPLRAMSEERPYSIANQVIDLGDFDSSNYAVVTQAKEEKIKLADAATIKANRGNSKIYLDVPSSEALTAKPTMPASEGSSTANDGPRPATQDFSFPPKEWNKQDQAEDEAEPGESSKPRDQSKHKTMEWSFASAMSEAQAGDTKPSPIDEEEEETRAKKHDTMQWSFSSAMAEASAPPPAPPQQQQTPRRTSRRAPPPLIRSITEPVAADNLRPSTSHSESADSTSTHDEADPFALDPDSPPPPAVLQALDERGISSFYGREGGVGVLEGPVSEGGVVQEEGEEEGEEEGRVVVTMPAIHGVDARALDSEAPPTALVEELDQLLEELQGVLGGAGVAVGAVGRRGRRERRGRGERRERRRMEEKGGEGERESEWEDEE